MQDNRAVHQAGATGMTVPRWRTIDNLPARLRPPSPRTAMLVLLLAATLVMPIQYKAGAPDEHAHTVFQGLIDAISGYPHHHAGDTAEQRRPTPVSPFANPAIPLQAMIDADLDSTSPSPVTDVPALLALSMPILAMTAVQALGLLVAAALARVADRDPWDRPARLTGWCRPLEPPPPRPA